MDRVLVRGIAWTGAAKYLTQVLRWASTIVVARLLTPDDYGVFSVAMIFVGFVNLLTEFGVGTAIVTLRDLDDDDVAQLNGLAVLFGAAACLVTCAAAFPLSLFYRTPELTAALLALSAGFIVKSFRTVPGALLQRELRFKTFAFLEGIEAVLLSGAVVVFALLGFGFWTLVIGDLLSGILGTALLLSRRRHRIAWPRFRRIGRAVVFSSHLVVSRLTWFWYFNADRTVAGRFLGRAAVGAYAFGHELASVPVEKITALVGRVAPAFLAAVQDDNAALRRYVLNITEGIAFLTVPACWGMALVADTFVPVVLGEAWLPAVAPLRLLAIYAAWRSIEALLHSVLVVKQDARYGARTGIACAILLPIAFYVGQHWGTAGIAWAWMAVHPVLLFPLYRRVLSRIELPVGRFLGAIWPSVGASLVMVAAVLAARATVPVPSMAVRLAMEVLVGALAYAAMMLTVFRGRLNRFRHGLKALKG
jgi:PST family polysaccharide transporter